MNIKPLSETNPFLRDPTERKRLIARSVRTSCGVEGVFPKSNSTRLIVIKHRKHKNIYDTTK